MRRYILPALGTALLLGAGGCGTMENLVTKEKGGPVLYGGVAADFKACQDILHEEELEGLHPGVRPLASHSKAVRFCGRVIDMPLSTVGDTLTIPFVAHHALTVAAAESSRPAPTAHEDFADDFE